MKEKNTVLIRMQKHKGSFQIITASILWGVISLFVRRLSVWGFDPMQIAFVRMTTAAVMLTLFALFRDKSRMKIKLRDIWMFAGTGIISIVLFNCCYFYGLIHGEASVAVVLLYTSPIFIMIFSRIIFKDKITASKIIALIMTIVGCVLVSGAIGSGHSVSAIVFTAGICSGLFYGLYSIFGKFALEKYDSLTVTVYTFIFGAIGSLPFSRPVDTVKLAVSSPEVILLCIGIGLISTLLPYYLYTEGLRYTEPSRAGILAAVEPMAGALIGITLFGESHNILKLSGIVLILIALIVNSFKT